MAGKFIVFEGLDMSGKTSQIAILKTYLELSYPNKKFVFTKEPGSSLNTIAPKIREVLLHTDEELSSATEALLYAADRSHHVDTLLKLLKDDVIVISDRYFYTSLAYQAYAGDLELKTVLDLNKIATRGLVPDLYIHMDLPLEAYLKRKSNRDSLDRIEQKDETFFANAIKGYKVMMKDMEHLNYEYLIPKRCITIDATLDMNDNANRIIKEINKLI